MKLFCDHSAFNFSMSLLTGLKLRHDAPPSVGGIL